MNDVVVLTIQVGTGRDFSTAARATLRRGTRVPLYQQTIELGELRWPSPAIQEAHLIWAVRALLKKMEERS